MNSLERELLALSPSEAAGVLEKAGLRVEIRYTGAAVRPGGSRGRERVLRLLVREDTGILTVACESDRQLPGRLAPGPVEADTVQ